MASELYVNPALSGNQGDGSIGTPYSNIRYCIEQATFDTTNGTRINVQTGTADVLTENLATSLADVATSVAWVPSRTAPLIIQGYTSAAGDGGIGELDGDATFPIFDDSTQDFIVIRDMKVGNVGANFIVQLGDTGVFRNVEFHTSTQNGVQLDFEHFITQCYFTGISLKSLRINGNCVTYGNFIRTSGTVGLEVVGDDGWACHNIVSCSGSADGIYVSNQGYFWNNSIWSNGGTGTGATSTVQKTGIAFFNNVVAGFSGVGGVGTDFTVGTQSVVRLRANNSYYDNETDHAGADVEYIAFGNETLSASPFTDPANGDFSPVDTGSVKEGSFPGFKL